MYYFTFEHHQDRMRFGNNVVRSDVAGWASMLSIQFPAIGVLLAIDYVH